MRAYAFRWLTLLFLAIFGGEAWMALPHLELVAQLPSKQDPRLVTDSVAPNDILEPDETIKTENISDVYERPLFQPSRKPFVAVQVAEAQPVIEEIVRVEQPELQPTEPAYGDPSQLTLKGVLLAKDKAAALIVTPDNAQGVWLSHGQVILGWTIETISPNSVLLKADGQSHLIQHYQQGSE